ncbi:hypothetical protein PFISCL1PPCAC_14645 [Pristionchus fissidentatus]|uniref:Uncharacterized protein n=1 Tax=Pristionchus fissidentatus TaxID=1538716 RepID=A0AAV5VYA9_9BILA|nr:hypothetical protein PFISCL1PPCAC_14645 [Pristionchus fissidentatus]
MVDRLQTRAACRVAVLSLLCSIVSAQVNNAAGLGNVNQNLNPNPDSGVLFTGSGTNLLYGGGANLLPFGRESGDQEVHQGFLTAGQTIDLHMYFPFYGGLYNYTTISVNGYLGFATVLDQGPTINVGPDATDWPRQQDPAMIAPYLCKQQVPQNANPGTKSGVYFRLLMRQSMFGRGSSSNVNYGGSTSQQSSFFNQGASQACQNTPDQYVRCDQNSDFILDELMRLLADGVAGANAFRADAALVVTWYNTASAISGRSDIDAGQLATYQVVWLADADARLSYVILNYDKLGFDAQDFRMNSRSGRCQALFNGGNHTGFVPVDPTFQFKNSPKVLATQSGVPHQVRGRYMFRVDDVVRPGGCSNKTGGTYPMLIYPNIVNMLGEMTVDVNAICLQRTQTYVLMIEQRQSATCTVINPSIARCHLPKIYDWGTKTVYFQPQSGGANEEKAFVGYIYFVPPTLDPMRLDIGNIYDWFKNPIPYQTMPISWYPRNFTNPALDGLTGNNIGVNDDQMYSVSLGLYVIGYKESKDDSIKKFKPENRVLCRLATYSNRNTPDYRFKPQDERINLYQVEQWYMNDWERQNELFTFRFGYLKLAPIKAETSGQNVAPELLSGLVSAPISIHFLWTLNNPAFTASSTFSTKENDERTNFVKQKSLEMCHDWYNEDGALWNFIHDVETNSSCPCIEKQAMADLGRFMPHPRCSATFRDITCTTAIGARNCYMSAQNVLSSYSGQSSQFSQYDTARFPTHYGQVCCYDAEGYLMQTSYQPVIKVTPDVPYNPGFPTRAYEFGTAPYMGQFEVPGLSMFHHDQMPYFLCCKYADFRCQMFYWRRPSSGCQEYQPPAYGEILGSGTFNTIDNQKFIFNEPGVFTLLYIPQTPSNPEVRIQVRLEKYPNRRVDFSMLGKYIDQQDLVQPTNCTVITGLVMEATGTDRVVVLARGDTRRFRYRTSVIVGNILRYFDTMKIQRFKGVMVYVNNVERGQPEIYVVLEEAQIGVRIRESHNMDIDRLPMYQESMGMLDIALSVPPQYGVRPDGDNTRDADIRRRYNIPKVAGLMRPFPDQPTNSMYNSITVSDVNSDAIHQQMIQMYRISGSGEYNQNEQVGVLNREIPNDNMFTTSRDEDKKFEVFPEAVMKANGIYKTSPKYNTGYYAFRAKTGTEIQQILNTCATLQNNPGTAMQPYQSQIGMDYAAQQCPDNPGAITQDCGDSWPCIYDYTVFNAKVLGSSMKDEWARVQVERKDAMKYYNSCGPINIEYPEYLMKTSSMNSAYLQGDVARFECFQSHWIKGVYEYKCGIVVDYNRPDSWRFEWNKGEQPWCRSREKENFFIWLSAIMGIIAVIMIVVFIFLCFWCVKNKKVIEQREKTLTRANSMVKYPASTIAEEEVPLNKRMPDFDRNDSPRTIAMSRPPGAAPQYSFPPPSQLSDHDMQAPPRSGLMGLDTSV